jgi:ribosomal protein L21E
VKEENILSDIELYPSHPSPEPEPLPIKEPDPSRNPSQHQSQHQSQSVTRHHKEFQEGDRVRITDNGLHHGKDGEVIHVGYGSTENDYVIALDKESHLSRQVVISVPHSQKFPILMKL